MSRQSNTVLFCVLLAVMATATSAFLFARKLPASLSSVPGSAQASNHRSSQRNLFLQPEAARVARNLGSRFNHGKRSLSFTVGTLTVSGLQRPLTITRQQTNTGEDVSVLIENRRLTWSEREGTKGESGIVSNADQLLMERLTLDSPDQFVLAQLRGASYFTIARNVRPLDAEDGYAGPLWDLVRIDEPAPEESQAQRLSPPRIYYINVQTGLPDRVESEFQGQQITTEFIEWTTQGDDRSPAHIRWSSNGQVIMEYRVTSFTRGQ